jgi:hypothetical protein
MVTANADHHDRTLLFAVKRPPRHAGAANNRCGVLFIAISTVGEADSDDD